MRSSELFNEMKKVKHKKIVTILDADHFMNCGYDTDADVRKMYEKELFHFI